MKTIYKYELEIKEVQTIKIPFDNAILCAQEQNSKICLWIAVDTENGLTQRTFRIFGTGNKADDLALYLGGDMEYISTVQMPNGLVWHVFIDL